MRKIIIPISVIVLAIIACKPNTNLIEEVSFQEEENFSSSAFANVVLENLRSEFDMLDDAFPADPLLVEAQRGNTARNTCNVPTLREELNSHRTVMKVFDGESNAGLAIPGFGGLTLGKKETSLHVYYIEPTTIRCNGKDVVYGIGYSMHLLIKKMKRGLDITKLPFIAASVQLNNSKTSVFYTMQTHGVKGIPIVRFFKPTVNKPFDVEGFGIMQSSINGIHGILGDSLLSSRVKFKPVKLNFVKPTDILN